MTRADLTPGTRYVVRNTMGGIFHAKLLNVREDGLCSFKVDMSGNPDWHGWSFLCQEDRVLRVAD